MSTLRLVKSMERSLTKEEQEAIVRHWQENPDMTEEQVIEHWEKKFGMPVTRHALFKLMINHVIPIGD